MQGYVRCAATRCWNAAVRHLRDIPVCFDHQEKILSLAASGLTGSDPEHETSYGDKRRAARLKTRAEQYGLTAEELEEIWDLQQGLCGVCQTALHRTGGKSFNIDHCHQSGKVRGLLCRGCNYGLGMFSDSPDRLKAAAAYLGRGASWGTGKAIERPRSPRKKPKPISLP